MKRKLLSVALLVVLSVGLVAACDNEDEDGGNGEYSIAITNKAELQEAWYIGDSTRSISVELSPEGNPTQEVTTGALTVVSSDPSVIAATGLNLSAQSLGEATITVNWHGASDSVALSVGESTYESIASINAGIKAGTIKDGDTVRFYGKVIGSMEQSTTHLYSGVYLGDGDESLMLYSGQISNLWFDGEEPIYHLGDDIAVAAQVSAYNGFYEFKPSLIVPLDSLTTSYSVTTPTVTVLDEAGWNALTYTDVGDLIEMELTYVSGSVSTAASTHSTINCTIGDSDVALYVNYHIGTEEVSALHDIIANLDEGDTLTVTGVVGWYNGPEICPQFIYANGKELAPSECVVASEKPGTTTLTITAEGLGEGKTLSIEKYFYAELGVSVDEGADKAVTWSTALAECEGNASYTSPDEILTIDEDGVIKTYAEGSVTITATAVKIGEGLDSPASDSITVTVTELATSTPFTSESVYYFGFNIDGTYMFIDGDTVEYNGEKQSHEGSVTSSLEKAVKVTVKSYNNSDKAFTLSFELSSTTYYIAIVTTDKGYINLAYVTTETPIYWSYELECWTDEGEENFLCYNSSYKCLYCSGVARYYGSSECARLIDYDSELVPEAITATAPVSTMYVGESIQLSTSVDKGVNLVTWELVCDSGSYATIDSTTGVLTATATGSVTAKATAVYAPTEGTAATNTVTVTVDTATYAASDTFETSSLASSYTRGSVVDSIYLDLSSIMFDAGENSSAPTYYTDTVSSQTIYNLRVYRYNVMTFAPRDPSVASISKIELTTVANGESWYNGASGMTATNATVDQNSTTGVVTLTPEDGTKAIALTNVNENKDNVQLRITQIVITYTQVSPAA